jgi:cytochrome c
MKTVFKGMAALALAMSVSSLALASDWEGGDAKKGEKVFKKCQVCHTIEKDGPNRVGPNLHGVFERKAASKADYKYSKAMTEKGAAGLKWDEETFFAYIENPAKLVPGTSMTFTGIKKEQDRRDLIAYMEIASGHKK